MLLSSRRREETALYENFIVAIFDESEMEIFIRLRKYFIVVYFTLQVLKDQTD
jgi:hypothetical protein